MRTVYLVSCVRKKRSTRSRAEDMYESDWFHKARAYTLSHARANDRWFILSAKHCLLDPKQAIEPYELTLNKMPVVERRQWAGQVRSQLRRHVSEGDRVVLLAGDRYREFLESELVRDGCVVVVPMRGLKIGKQLQWLKREITQ